MNGADQRTPKSGGRKAFALLGVILMLGVTLYASYSPLSSAPSTIEDPKDKKPTPRAVDAANAFLDALDGKQKEKALYEFESTKKPNWSNLPVTIVQRNGVRLGDLNKD